MQSSKNTSPPLAMKDPEIKQFAIEFDRNNKTYIPGELVSGKVLVEFIQSKQIRGLYVVIVGESMVQWTSRRYDPDPDSGYRLTIQPKSPIRVMTGYEEYFSTKFYLLGSDSSSPFVLPAGQQTYPFQFQLPIKLPNSFEHQSGYVRYTIRAIFDRPQGFIREAKTTFAVNSIYDLNRKSEASIAIREDIVKNFLCSCIFPTGKIYARLTVPAAGFVPGQVIPVTVHCDNESTIDVTKIKVSLRRTFKFHAKSPHSTTKTEESVIAEAKRIQPFINDFREWITIPLKVPNMSPTGLETCGLIDVDYVLRIIVCFSGMHFSVDRSFPILIGTVPLSNLDDACISDKGNLSSVTISDSSHRHLKNQHLRSFDISIDEKYKNMHVQGYENSIVPRYFFDDCSLEHTIYNPLIRYPF